MQSHFEQRQVNVSRDYGQTEASYDVSSSSASTTGTYRSAMGPRVTNIQRSRASGLGGSGGGVMTRVYQQMQSGGASMGFGQGLGAIANFGGVPMRGGAHAETALVGFNVTRHRDKRELVQLNDKFAQYIEKVRFLEAQNRKLVLELETLRSRSTHGSSRIKEMYDLEMAEGRKLVEDTRRDAAAAHIKTQQAEVEVKRQRSRYTEISSLRETDRKEVDSLQLRIAENEAQTALFRRRIADLEDESRRYKAESQRISGEIGRLQSELQNELFLKSSCEVERLSLDDELTSLKHIHDGNLNELRSQCVSTDLDPSQFFRNELAQAIREIRSDYEAVVESQRSEMQNRYSVLYQELIVRQQRPDQSSLQTETQRRQEERFRSELLQTQNQNGYLRAKIQDSKNHIEEIQRRLHALREEGSSAQLRISKEIEAARRRLDQVNHDYTEVTSLKTSLEKEIHDYRDLLESQTGLRGYVDRIVQHAEQHAIEHTAVANLSSGLSSGFSAGSSGGLSGGSTTISRTVISSGGGGGVSYGSSAGSSGISTLISSATRPASSYQQVSSSSKSVYQSGSSSHMRSSGDF